MQHKFPAGIKKKRCSIFHYTKAVLGGITMVEWNIKKRERADKEVDRGKKKKVLTKRFSPRVGAPPSYVILSQTSPTTTHIFL